MTQRARKMQGKLLNFRGIILCLREITKTKNQLADILTKCLWSEQFKHIQNLLMDWISASCLRGSVRIIS